jgi:SAM-dependent methyltransferase
MTSNEDAKAYVRYLEAKKFIDDRALNRQVWETLKASLTDLKRYEPVRVIEMGAGIGTMFARAVEWGLAPAFNYQLVEVNPYYLNAAKRRCRSLWSGLTGDSARPSLGVSGGVDYTAEYWCADLYDIISDPRQSRQWDLVIAHAVMDLVDIAVVLEGFRQLLRSEGLLYLSLNYDGITRFLPLWDPDFEKHMMDRYHYSMDTRLNNGRPSGSSQSGRDLITGLKSVGIDLKAAGSSDWMVWPHNRRYSAHEIYFLEMIVDTIASQLRLDPAIDATQLEAWAAHRHAQIASGELIFMAHNLDLLAALPRSQG